jgi:hypothetical protein
MGLKERIHCRALGAIGLLLAVALLGACPERGRSSPNPPAGHRGAGELKMRGTINPSEDGEFIYQYYDVHEPDSHSNALQAQGWQGGGPTWEGIIYGLLELRSPSTLQEIRFDAEGDGLAIWSRKRTALESIAQLVAEAKASSTLLNEAIERAKRAGRME